MTSTLCRTALVLLGLSMAAAGRADTTYTWNFATATSNGDTGLASAIYLDNSRTYSLPVHAYTTANDGGTRSGNTWTTGSVTDVNYKLYNKYNSGASNPLTDTETGLGLTVSSNGIQNNNDGGQHEIFPYSFVQLDVVALKTANLISPTIMISSIQSNEGYYLWGSNSAGVPGTLLNTYINSTGADTNRIALPSYATYRYFSVSATSGDVLLQNGFSAVKPSATATPEPGVVALLLGLSLPTGLLIRRRNRR